jgi:hypothetical protein
MSEARLAQNLRAPGATMGLPFPFAYEDLL